MTPPTLPVELVALIVDYTAQTPAFNFLQAEWSSSDPTHTLHALCLASLALNKLATPHLYSHVTLPTPGAGEAFVRTLGMERWRTGKRAGKADKWVRTVSLGRQGDEEVGMSGSVVSAVLGELRGARVERVAVSGVELDVQAFADMQDELRKQLSSK